MSFRISVILSRKRWKGKTYVHIEHVKVDKVEYNIDFEKLSIEELSGMLNIGATYHTPAHRLKQACAEEFRDNPQTDVAKEKDRQSRQTPNVTIRGESIDPVVSASFFEGMY